MPEEFPTKIESDTQVSFTVDKFGLYAITVIASCEKHHDLKVEIDNEHQTFNTSQSWNGTNLKSLSKTVIFILTLEQGPHTLRLSPNSEAFIKKWSYRIIQNPQKVEFKIEEKSEDGNRRSWITFALINTSLKSITAEASVSWHLFDGDDIKLIVDNEIEKNTKSKLWKYWVWHAIPQQVLTGSKRQQKTFNKDLQQGAHYIEFWADKTPTLHIVTLDLGDYKPKRTPTVENPEWTGDFSDDIDRIILARALFGEARDTFVPDMVRVAIGWTIRNRVGDSRWPSTYHGVITEPSQYSSFNNDDQNRPYVENPLHSSLEIDREAWKNAYEVAEEIINNKIKDPTQGANHYYDDSINVPKWAEDETPTYSISYKNKFELNSSIFFYKL